MSKLIVVPFGSAAAALRDVVRSLKATDPIAPVTVAGPSNYAHLSLRRRLGAGPLRLHPDGPEGLVNVRFMPLARLAELLGAPRLARSGRRLLTDAMRAEAVRIALAEAPGVFGPFRGHASTAASLEATFRDLRGTGADARAALAAQGARAQDVVALFEAFERRTAGFYDDTDLMDAAAEEATADGQALREIGHVILYLPRELPPAAERFLRALAARGLASVILGASGDPEADAPAAALRGCLSDIFTADERGTAEVPAGHALVCAPDPEEEVRAAIRAVNARLAQGRPLYRTAILYRSARPYALLAHEQLHAAGIPHNGHDIGALSQSLAGAALLGLLRLADADFHREAVIDWLAGAPIRDADGEVVPAHAWGEIARAAGVVKGHHQWLSRLDHYRARIAAERQRRVEETDENASTVLWADRRLMEIDRLKGFIQDLGGWARPEGLASWTAGARWAEKALARYLGADRHMKDWPEEEIAAREKVLRALNDLGALSVIREQTDLPTFRRALERALSSGAKRLGRFGEGVFVGALKDALGMQFDEVFILGMNEGSFPPRPREDPLLPDREREAGGIPSRSEAAAEERRDYLAALASAERATLLCSRADPRAGRETLPCPWYLETAGRLAGRPVYSRDVEALAAERFMDDIPSFHAALRRAGEPASAQEHDLAALLRAWCAGEDLSRHPAMPGAAQRGFAAMEARQGEQFTHWDGRLKPDAALLPSPAKPISPSSLQMWAQCPFQYMLSRVLHVAETEKPEDRAGIRATDRGDLFHEALEAFFRDRLGAITPDTEWTEEDRRALLAIADALVERYERAGTGEAIVWEMERRRLRRDLLRFLDQDERFRASLRLTPIAVELAFEPNRAAAALPAVTLPSGHTLTFRGRIDRVDRAEDGALWVWDYKTGKKQNAGKIAPDPVDGGKLLQLPVYALAAERALGNGHAPVRAHYWFVREVTGKDANTMGYAVDDAALEAFHGALNVIAGGMRDGLFPSRPDGNQKRCGYCPYDAVCRPDRERSWERKRTCDELRPFLAMAGDAGRTEGAEEAQ